MMPEDLPDLAPECLARFWDAWISWHPGNPGAESAIPDDLLLPFFEYASDGYSFLLYYLAAEIRRRPHLANTPTEDQRLKLVELKLAGLL